MRKPSACTTCRARRRKCNYADHATACEYCIIHALHCVQGPPEGGYYAKRKERLQTAAVTLRTPPSHSTPQPLPPLALRQQLVELYFDYIHDQFHSIFHQASFMTDVANDNVPHILLFAIFALAARFSPNKAFAGVDPRERGEVYRSASEKLFSIRDLSSTTIQVCLLLGAYEAANGETGIENLYYSTAARLALVLDLPNRPAVNLVEREVNIRIWWAICMVDVWSSTAVKLPRFMPTDTVVALPIDEIPFSSLNLDTASELVTGNTSVTSPLLAEMIKLNRILSHIIDFNQKCVSEHLEGKALQDGIHELSQYLQTWLEELPANMRDTRENLEFFTAHGLGRMFVAVYLGAYHYGQLLYYQFLSSSSEGQSDSAGHSSICKHYAAKLCSLVYRSQSTIGSEVLYSAVSHILVIASTVQIHTLLFSDDEGEIRISKSRLERNFEMLLRLRTYWPSVDGAMSRLRAFHQTCLRSKETSFVLDRWLLRFLVEFAPHMELEPRDNDPEYEALLALSRQSPLSCYSGLSV